MKKKDFEVNITMTIFLCHEIQSHAIFFKEDALSQKSTAISYFVEVCCY